MKQIKISFVTAILFFSLTNVALSGEYVGVYKSGDATSFKKNTKLKISKDDSKTYNFNALDGSATWQLPIDTVRGAQAGSKGVWVYWFSGDNTLNAYIEMDSSASSSFASELTSDVTSYHQAPIESAEEAKARYESYHQEAIKQAR